MFGRTQYRFIGFILLVVSYCAASIATAIAGITGEFEGVSLLSDIGMKGSRMGVIVTSVSGGKGKLRNWWI